MVWKSLYRRSLKKTFKNRITYINKKERQYNFTNLHHKINNYKHMSYFHVPETFDVAIVYQHVFKKYVVCMYGNTYYFKLVFDPELSSFKFDSNTGVASVHSHFPKFTGIDFKNAYYKLFYTFAAPTIFRIKFRGKGYYLYKNKRHTITPQFNYAHRIFIYTYFVGVRFLSKTTVLLFSYDKLLLLKAAKRIQKPRPINIFTGRGVRFAKQVIYKKVGKVSSYR